MMNLLLQLRCQFDVICAERKKTRGISDVKQTLSAIIRKAFGHATEPRKGPRSTQHGINSKKLQEVGKAMPYFRQKVRTRKQPHPI